MNIISIPFGWLMKLCYMIVKNYGIALILFTFLIKLILFPLSVKQQKSSARMARLSPKLEKIKKQYANNQQKMNEETQKLYAEENINPMESCLPAILSIVVLFAIIDVVYCPLTYVSGLDKAEIKESTTLLTNIVTAAEELDKNDLTVSQLLAENKDVYETINSYEKSKALKDENGNNVTQQVAEILSAHDGLDEYINNPSKFSKKLISHPELLMFNICSDENYQDIFPQKVVDEVNSFEYTFLGIFLGSFPSWSNALVLIPILSCLTQLACTVVQQIFTKKNNPAAAKTMSSMNAMLYILPVFSLWIAFSYPAGLGIYWIISSVFALIQIIVLNVIYTPAYMEKLAVKEAASNKKKKKKSFYQKMLEAQQLQNGTAPSSRNVDIEEVDQTKLSKAEIAALNRKRINEARKRMAEKYGDEYNETDD